MDLTKECSRCRKVKSASCFGIRRNRKSGLASRCNDCRAEVERERRKNSDYGATYYLSNKDKARANNSKWYSLNKERSREKSSNRRALLSDTPNLMPSDWWQILLSACGFKCCRCGGEENLTHDHVIPITWLGSVHCLENSQVLCAGCNSRKQNRNADDYRTPQQIAELCQW